MKVVCNATPLISLSSINKLYLFKELFGEITIPKQVFNEVVASGSDKYGSFEVKKSSWIKVEKTRETVLKNYLMKALDAGEAEVIVLAVELDAELVIIDERLARKYAKAADLNLIGTLGIIAKAKQVGLIPDARSLMNEMLSKGRWFNIALINRILSELDEEIL